MPCPLYQDLLHRAAEYSRTFMRQACAYVEGKEVTPVSAVELARASGRAITPPNASLDDSPPSTSAGV